MIQAMIKLCAWHAKMEFQALIEVSALNLKISMREEMKEY